MAQIIPSSSFIKSVKHLDKAENSRLQKEIKKILKNPEPGKPLKYA
jgi:mRNA-degrading endonuclease RelE of RelBE toxin-antitoxin system